MKQINQSILIIKIKLIHATAKNFTAEIKKLFDWDVSRGLKTCMDWLLLQCVRSFSKLSPLDFEKSIFPVSSNKWLLWQIKCIFKNDNVLYINRVLHQDDMFLIKVIGIFFARKESTLLAFPLSDNAKEDFFLTYHNIFQYS